MSGMEGKIVADEYRIESVLGEGANGIVYLCEEIPLKRRVAMKMLNRVSVVSRDLERFLDEARKLASLNHPNVVQIYRLGYYEGSPFIVMEYLTGQSLSEIFSGPMLPSTEGLEIMRQVAAGLDAIHGRGIIHRDLSCNNILVTASGQRRMAKILDLGLAKDLSRLTDDSRQGFIVGTLAYIAPEQIDGGHSLTPAADVFSFGILLFQILTGRHPFQAEHYMSLLYNVLNREAPDLAEFFPNAPPALVRLVHACLDKSPGRRPADLAVVEQELARLAAGGISGPDGPVRPREYDSVLPTRSSANPYLNRVMIKRREDFYGRAQEIRRIFSRLNATPPGSVSIEGDRKIGKSSLLNYVYMKKTRDEFLEQPDRTIMVFIDLQEEKNMSLPSFVKILLSMADFELRGRISVADCTADLDGIKELVRRLEGGGFRLVVLLDEFEAVTANANFNLEFFSFLRYLANRYNVAYVTSSARNLQLLCHTKQISDSPFFNIFTNMRLSVLQPKEAEDLIRVPSERIGKPLAPYRQRIVGMAGYFPFFIQVSCSHMIEYLDEHPERSEPDFEEVKRRFLDEAQFHFRYIWDNFDSHEQSAVVRLARGKGIPDSLKHVLVELSGRHLVEVDGQPPRLFSPTFQEFVKLEASKEGGGSFPFRWFGKG